MKVYKLIVLLLLMLLLSVMISGCRVNSTTGSNKKYTLPTNKQLDSYLKTQKLTNIISIDAIDNKYINILYKVNQNGIGFRVVTSVYNRVVSISDGKTIYEEKIPEVAVGGMKGDVEFRYVYLSDSISKAANKIKLDYYNSKNEINMIEEITNQRNCFIYSGSQYDNIVKGFHSISLYDEAEIKIYGND